MDPVTSTVTLVATCKSILDLWTSHKELPAALMVFKQISEAVKVEVERFTSGSMPLRVVGNACSATLGFAALAVLKAK